MKQPFDETAAALLLSLVMVSRLASQPLQLEVVASFSGTNGRQPEASLTLGSDGNFYSTTRFGGSFDDGTVFRVTTNGDLTTLVSFLGTNGAYPYAGLALGSDGNFYGATSFGSTFNAGTVFQVATNGVLTTLASFAGTNGANAKGLTLGSDGNLYGTTDVGGNYHEIYPNFYGDGTVFRVTTNGTPATLVLFAGTNGAEPNALTLGNDGNFYGTTWVGGKGWNPRFYDYGTVFRVTTDGALTTLVFFAGTNGSQPHASLTLSSDGHFYGTTEYGGSRDYGTVFRVTTNGVLTTLASFSLTNGAYPQAALTLGSDGNLYGTTEYGGNLSLNDGYGDGTVFQVTPKGVLTTLVSFASSNGRYPYGGLTLGYDGDFYGTTSSGGTGDAGVIFRLRRGVSIQSFELTANGFKLNTLNLGGSGWVVLESSSDLAHWTPIQTNGTAAAQQFLDAAAVTAPRQFYRVRQK